MTLNQYPLLIPLAPLIAALITAFPFRNKILPNYLFSWWLMIVSFLVSLLQLARVIQEPEFNQIVLFSWGWSLLPEVAMSVDRLSSVMMVFISGFGVLLYRYSVRYLQQDAGHDRYLTLFALCISSLLFMVSCADFIMLFIFWQLLSWFLSLLSHNYLHGPTIKSGFRTFIILRAGDLTFIAGIALAYHLYGTLEFNLIFARASIDQTIFSIFGSGLQLTGVTLVTILIFVGAMSKSAQIPLHMWLPDSLFAPTPIHALLHAGLINAGGFLLARLAPLFSLSSTTLHIVLFIGLLTAILATSMMMVQNDIKKTLGYSTIGQMGYMMMECGLGAFHLAIFHLMAHGLFKADIFLNIGKGIHNARLYPSKPFETNHFKFSNYSSLISAFVFSFLFPITILFGSHIFLGVHFLDYHALIIFLLFSWATTSQAMLTLVRLEKPLKIKIGMLLGISFVGTVYFFVAESFAHFLITSPIELQRYLLAGALPSHFFLLLVTIIILSISLSWFFSLFHFSNIFTFPFGIWLKRNIYLLFLNRLYFDHFSEQLFNFLRMFGKKLNQTRFIFIIFLIISILFSYFQKVSFSELSVETGIKLVASALCLPLFPFHGLYVIGITKTSRISRLVLAIIFPIVGFYFLDSVISGLPKEILPAITVFATIGASWAIIKTLTQVSILSLITYGGLALYSIFWLVIGLNGYISDYSIAYVWSLTIVIWGLVFSVGQLIMRYGEFKITTITGLFKTMPYFTLLFGLLIMAAIGLPPFSLFFGYVGILMSPSFVISLEFVGIIIIWFMSCWYFFKIMQSLLFGVAREDIYYKDLYFIEIAVLTVVLLLLIIPVSILINWLNLMVSSSMLILGI